MQIHYDPTPDGEGNHRIFYVVWQKDIYAFKHQTHTALSILDIDEIGPNANRALLIDVHKTQRLKSESGGRKYALNSSLVLVEDDEWERYNDPA